MKTSTIVMLIAAVVSTGADAKSANGSISPYGETALAGRLGSHAIKAVIKTHIVDIGTVSDPIPEEPDSNCTYSRVPCSVVDDFKLFVNGKRVRVPRSVFADLADLNRGHFTTSEHGMTLILEAGDASGAYKVYITFDGRRVLRRKVESGEFPDNLWEETKYVVEPVDPNL